MHIYQARMTALALLVALAACRNGSSVSRVPAHVGRMPTPEELCEGRLGCRVIRAQSVDGLDKGAAQVVYLGFRHPADAGSDIVRCDRREYWLVDSPSPRLIATDCEEQSGADDPGPADTALGGTKMTFRYLEGGSNDTCDTYQAVVDLNVFRIESQERLTGEFTPDNRCINLRPHPKFVPPGDGTPPRPLVTLHP